MIAVVLLVATFASTDAKSVVEKTLTVDMNLEVDNGKELHEAFMSFMTASNICEGITVNKVDSNGQPTGETAKCYLISDTNNVEVSYNSDNSILKMTTRSNLVSGLADYMACIDPTFILDFVTSFKAAGYKYGMPYTVNGTTYDGLSTDIIRYAVVSYYIPCTEIPERAYHNNTDYSVADFNHLRMYTATTYNQSDLFGVYRFMKFTDAFSTAEAKDGTVNGRWVIDIIDLQAVNLRGISSNGTNSSNGWANWDGYLRALRFDIGQIGSIEAWFNGTTNHDAPAGKSIYIRDILFFNSYHRALRAKINLAKETKPDPTTLGYSNPVQIEDGKHVPSTTLQYDAAYVYVPTVAEEATEDTVEVPNDW